MPIFSLIISKIKFECICAEKKTNARNVKPKIQPSFLHKLFRVCSAHSLSLIKHSLALSFRCSLYTGGKNLTNLHYYRLTYRLLGWFHIFFFCLCLYWWGGIGTVAIYTICFACISVSLFYMYTIVEGELTHLVVLQQFFYYTFWSYCLLT